VSVLLISSDKTPQGDCLGTRSPLIYKISLGLSCATLSLYPALKSVTSLVWLYLALPVKTKRKNPLMPNTSFTDLETRLNNLRRENASLDASPIIVEPGSQPVDYSYGCLLIDLAKKNLDEACPDRQKERISLSLEVLHIGLDSLKEWARLKGVPVADLKEPRRTFHLEAGVVPHTVCTADLVTRLGSGAAQGELKHFQNKD